MLASKGGKGPSTHKDCCSLVFQAQGRLQPDKAETQDCSLATACGQHQVMGLWPITLLHVTRPKTVPAVQCDVPCMLRHTGHGPYAALPVLRVQGLHPDHKKGSDLHLYACNTLQAAACSRRHAESSPACTKGRRKK